MDFTSTALWERSLIKGDEKHAAQRERLRAAYFRFWENACDLANLIGRDLPGLTLHDARHFEALWDRADQIAGELELTPVEAFIFGGAILLHDAANTVAAFPGGMAEITSTAEWRDAVASLGANPGTPRLQLEPDIAQEALLRTLRSIHATRAETLGDLSVRNPQSGVTNSLIQDDLLRTHLGGLIGQVAASHHWDIDELEKRLPPHIGALAGFPREWIVRPVLLACLLRCADALQLDQSRTPDFLMALLNVRGISETHWRAQNLLTAPLTDPVDPRALIFSSTRAYRHEDADAWWIAYDAIKTAHSELQASSVLLNDLGLPTLAIDRIRNAESPVRLSSTVQTVGWRPVSAELQANRVARLIDMFGGSQLYGEEPAVAVRELLQNAIDAVRQRKALEPTGSSYTGSITVHLLASPEGGSWLVVEDDGIGMSEAVLTGPLIDFGESYVASRLAQQERPGLSAAATRRLGRYGVGFFSIFMLGDHVQVSSRPFDRSMSDLRTLSFRAGLSLRPLLLDAPVADFGAQTSTRVAVLVSTDKLEKLLEPRWGQQRQTIKVTLEQMVQALCPFSDVDIFFKEAGESRRLARSLRTCIDDPASWLRQITLADARQQERLDVTISASMHMLRPLDPSDLSAGVAAVNMFGGALGVHTIGGLRATDRWSGYSEDFIGSLDGEPEGPARFMGHIRASAALPAWANAQAALVAQTSEPALRKIAAAARIAQFGGNPSQIAGAQLNSVPTLVPELVDLLQGGESLAVLLQGERFGREDEDNRLVFTSLRVEQYDPFMSFFRREELEFLVKLLEPISTVNNREFWSIPEAGQEGPETFFGCLVSECLSRGFGLDFAPQDIAVARYIGLDSPRDGLTSGSDVVRAGALLRSVSNSTSSPRSQ